MFQAYVRGNKTNSGAFFINALWFSLLQFLWLFIIFTMIELFFETGIVRYLSEIYIYIVIILVILLLNLFYIYAPGRKNLIITRFKFSVLHEKVFFYSTILLFFICLWIAVYLAGVLMD